MNVWIGSNWVNQHRRLIVGESWYGPEESLHRYVQRWCAGTQPDHFITRIFNSCSGHCAATATQATKLEFWEQLAFTNFVYWSVGTTNLSKARTNHFVLAQPDFGTFLKVLRPDAVWILGLQQGVHSASVVSTTLGIKPVVTKHPAGGVSDAQLLADFQSL